MLCRGTGYALVGPMPIRIDDRVAVPSQREEDGVSEPDVRTDDEKRDNGGELNDGREWTTLQQLAGARYEAARQGLGARATRRSSRGSVIECGIHLARISQLQICSHVESSFDSELTPWRMMGSAIAAN
jgi:hypothetical protein